MELTAEKRALLTYLHGPRNHVLGILEGLSEEDLRRAVLPSGWCCLALVQHLALDIERFWFRALIAGDPAVIAALDGGAWELDPAVSPETIIEQYRQEIALADAVLVAADLDGPTAWWPEEQFGDFRLHTVREVILHVITETACHAGHLDAARELIDGRQWFVIED